MKRWLQTVTLVVLTLVFSAFSTGLAAAQGLPKEQKALYNLDIQRFNYTDNSGCTGASNAGIPQGTLPAMIPEPYNGAFTKGANMFKVAPALIAALFTEENFTATPVTGLAQRWANFPKVHPDPNSGWPTNQYQTMGAFQFIPGTWAAYGADGNGDGDKNPQQIADGAAGAANYVAHNGATADKPPASWQNAIFAYNHAQWYVDAVMMYYNFYSSGGTNTSTVPSASAGPSSGSCASPISNVNCGNGAGTGVRAKAACLAMAERDLWKSGQMKKGTDFHKYSQGRDEDWCADFVSWIYNQAGYPLNSARDGNVPAVNTIAGIGKQNQKFTWHALGSYQPQPGDMVIYQHDDPDPKKSVSHVNMVTRTESDGIWVTGGNQAGTHFSNSLVTEYKMQTSAFGSKWVTGFVSPQSQI